MKARAVVPILASFAAGLAFTYASGLAAAPQSEIAFDGVQWIWAWPDAAANTSQPPAGTCYFRSSVTLPAGAKVKAADAFVTADNLFTLYINGKIVGQSTSNPNDWSRPKHFNVASLLQAGTNMVAVEAVNTAPGPAGLLVRLTGQLADGSPIALATDDAWKVTEKEEKDWFQPAFGDGKWQKAYVVCEYGQGPWGKFRGNLSKIPLDPPWTPDMTPINLQSHIAPDVSARAPAGAAAIVEAVPPADYPWPDAVAYVSDDCSLYHPRKNGTSYDSLTVTVFTARKSQAYPEHDLPAPIKVGRKLCLLKPAHPGTTPRVLLDAGKGALGSPAVSFDGKSIFVSMAPEGEGFFHIYRLTEKGSGDFRLQNSDFGLNSKDKTAGKSEIRNLKSEIDKSAIRNSQSEIAYSVQKLTSGPFHDIDPAELPDGRIVFASTRIGMFDEYHNPPARALFVMNADGGDIHPITHTFVFDNQPRVLSDGRILFVRSDNFFDRGKVETLLHAIHPDGTDGYTEFGLDNGPDYGSRLRAFYCGTPAPMPDGRVAFVSAAGVTVGRPGSDPKDQQILHFPAGDVSALPDGRLLCSVARMASYEVPTAKGKQTRQDFSYEKIALIDPAAKDAKLAVLFDSAGTTALHSPVYVGPSQRPEVLAEKVDSAQAGDPRATGFLFCRDARFTRNTTAGWGHVRAIRVLMGKGLTLRSSHSYIVHAGSEVVELGTVPLAEDGSFHVEVPADTAVAFQAVDAEGRSELNEMSWIVVRPGEHRSCLGCHQPRQAFPPTAAAPPQALQAPPLKLLGLGRQHRFRGNNAAVTGLMELQFDRYREVAGINRHSDSADPLATGPQEVAALTAELRSADEAVKISSCQRLAIFRDPSAAPALAQCLRDPSREVRVAAAIALAACGTRQSLQPLLAAMNDADPLAAHAAAIAIENLTGHAQEFNAFLPPPQRAAAMQAWAAWFAAHPWEAVERDLIARLEGGDRDLARRAAVAMGHTGSSAAMGALRKYVEAGRQSTAVAEWHKKFQGDGAKFNSLADANPRALQAAARSLGYLKDASAVPMLAETIRLNDDPATGNLFLAEAAIEALGRIGTAEAQQALIDTLGQLKEYQQITHWYGDHGALIACHASPLHYFIAEALDAAGSKNAGPVVCDLIRSVPTDPDRALMPGSDDCETLFGRVIRRSGAEAAVVETCLSILGDDPSSASGSPRATPRGEKAVATKPIAEAMSKTAGAWAGKPEAENRAAQILSLTCRDHAYEPRVRAALDRYRTGPPDDIARVFDHGIPVVQKLPTRHWVCFYLARTLGNMGDRQSAPALIAVLEQCPPEAAGGYPDPTGPGVLFLHNDLTPCYRAEAAWALGRIGDRSAVPLLLKVVADLQNAIDTRHAAAEALGALADPSCREAIGKLAAEYPEVSTRRALLRAAAGM